MTMTEANERKIHLGYNFKRTREIIGMKQETLATILGMAQPHISKLEQSESITDEMLDRIAKGLGVTPEFIKNFNEDKAIYNIQSNFTVQDNASFNNQPTIYNNDPIDKLMGLFEKLLQNDKEKTDLLLQTNKALMELNDRLKKS